jgi:Xaa-Pro aminopeptidase
MENLKPGVTVKELAELTASLAEQTAPKSGPAAGATAQLTMHGRGAGDDGPIITSHARSPRQLSVALRENMVFIFKPSVKATDGSISTWGDTVLISAKGGQRLGKRPHDLAVSP